MTENSWTVIAHQGGNQLRPGDTMAAFEHAVELGVDALELDVHATADGVLVVIHDDTVDRTTNGTGAVSELTLEEIKALDAGYNWPLHEESDEYPFRGTGVTIPTLEEVLVAFPDMPMAIEIKQADPPIVEPFGNLLKEYDRAGNTIVASFHPEVMQEFREQFPEFATAGVEPEIRRFFVLNKLFLGRSYRPPMNAFQVPERFGNLKVITPRFVRVAQSRGLAVHVWTINHPDDMERILDTGVDGIMTDRPDLLLDVVESRTRE
jgi:glycerophosphoryl diester phosphodiesterase